MKFENEHVKITSQQNNTPSLKHDEINISATSSIETKQQDKTENVESQNVESQNIESKDVATDREMDVQADSKPTKNTGKDNEKWKMVLELIKREKAAVYAILQGSTVQSKSGGVLAIKLKQKINFFIQKLSEETHQQFINAKLKEVFKEENLTFAVTDQVLPKSGPPTHPQQQTQENQSQEQSQQQVQTQKSNVSEQEMSVNSIVEMFEGAIV